MVISVEMEEFIYILRDLERGRPRITFAGSVVEERK